MSSLSHLVISQHLHYQVCLNNIYIEVSYQDIFIVNIETDPSRNCISRLEHLIYFIFLFNRKIYRRFPVMLVSLVAKKYLVSGAASEVPVTVVCCV